jgi:beta-N-acetylhexosaminidase
MSARLGTGAGTALHRDILTTLLPGFAGTAAPDWLLRRLEEGLGGVCIFGPNITDAEQLRALNASLRGANPLAVVAIDEEGGDVTRLFYDRGAPYPGNALLGRMDDVGRTEQVARAVGQALVATGCTLALGPDVDVNSNPDNPVIGVRSFGSDPHLAARHAAAWVRGVQGAGAAASAKHFPGHGDTATDSHLDLPVVDVSPGVLHERELVPFRAAIAAGARTIMTSHILMPELDAEEPATFSRPIIEGLLRAELGFEGVVVTDALDMRGASAEHGIPKAAVRALVAGCDLLCIGSDNTDEQLGEIVAAVRGAVESGRLSAERVRAAAARVRALAAEAPPAPAATITEAAIEPVHPGGELAAIATAFEVSDAAATRLAMRGVDGIGTVVRVDTVANIAIGVAPWGPFAAATSGERSWLDDARIVRLAADAPLEAPAALEGLVLVVGKDLHRHPFAVAAIEALRAVRDDVVTVDMGWPSEDRAHADIATFGASRLVGAALLELLASRRALASAKHP